MSINLFSLLALSLITKVITSQTTLYTESFETDAFGTNYVMNRFCDGGQDYFGVVDSWGNTQYLPINSVNPFTFQMTNLNGTQCIAAEDLKREDNPLNINLDDYRGYFITKTIDVSSYSNIDVKILLGAKDPGLYGTVEANDNDAVRIQYAFDANIAIGGNNLSPGLTADSNVYTGNYTDIGRFLASAPTQGVLKQDTDLDGIPDGDTLDNTMTEYVFSIPVTGNKLSVRIHMDYDDSAEEVAFDYIRLIGTNTVNISKNILNPKPIVYPNPTKGNLTVNLGKAYKNIIIKTKNSLGQTISSYFYKSLKIVDLQINGKKGVYFIEISSNSNTSYFKVIKN